MENKNIFELRTVLLKVDNYFEWSNNIEVVLKEKRPCNVVEEPAVAGAATPAFEQCKVREAKILTQ